jgi:diguanylate cyclase (GGDEF)-like protein
MATATNQLLNDFCLSAETSLSHAEPEWMSVRGTRNIDVSNFIGHFKRLHFMARLLTPGVISSRLVLITSILAMAMIVYFEQVTPPEIRLHILYLFPLAAIALHCDCLRTVLSSLALSIAFQLWTVFNQDLLNSPIITDGLITIASSILAIALARASRANYLATVSLAATDWLTGLYNRRSFESAAENEITRQRRYGGVFSLAVIDLDGFKKLNDSKGHRAGDAALKLLADLLREHTRQTDLVARLGGDEFAVLMPNTQTGACLSLCRQLAIIVASRMSYAGFGITASLGCSSFEEAPESTAAALQKADSAMYVAKENGKGCAASL